MRANRRALWYNEIKYLRMATGKSPGAQPVYTREQRVGVALLAIFAVLIVVLGLLQMRNTIYKNFVIRIPESAANQAYLQNNAVALQQRDTDRDGLSDYDEQEFYNTSIYLPDSDSDGISDKEEIDNGTNPLCPEGQVCASQDAPKETVTGASGLIQGEETPLNTLESIGDLFGKTPGLPEAQGTAEASADLSIDELTANPDLLRQILLSTGVLTQEQLEKFDDETLIKLAEELKQSQASASQTQNNAQNQ